MLLHRSSAGPPMSLPPPSPSLDEKLSEKGDHHVEVNVNQVDTAAQVAAGAVGVLDPKEADRVRKKIDMHVLPLMCSMYLSISSRSNI